MERPRESRLLIVGQSHYVCPKEGEDPLKSPHLTREVVIECLICEDDRWNHTFNMLTKLLFGTSEIDYIKILLGHGFLQLCSKTHAQSVFTSGEPE